MILSTAAIVGIICLAYFMQAAFAFGGSLIAVPLLSLFVGPKDAIVLATVFSVLGSVLIFKLWEHINWRQVRWLTPSIFVGLTAGLALFSLFNERLLAAILALYIIVYVLNDILKLRVMVALDKKIPEKWQSFIGGFSGGLIQGATGIGGGPPIVAHLKKHTLSNNEFRATFMFVWLMANILRLLFMSSADFVHGMVVTYALVTIPFFLPVIFLGYYLPRKIGQRSFDFAVNTLLLLSAASILVKEFA